MTTVIVVCLILAAILYFASDMKYPGGVGNDELQRGALLGSVALATASVVLLAVNFL